VGAALEPISRFQGLRSSALRKSLSLSEGSSRILLDPDGSLGAFDSLSEKRVLFGREQVHFYKVQAGVVVQAQRQELSIRATPRSAQFAGRIFEGVEVLQSVGFFHGGSVGYFRKVKLRNGGPNTFKIRMIDVSDPTAAQFGDSPTRWGALGLNAFNRGSHVAMDEVSEPPSARVFGSQPQPSKFYMSTDKGRVQEFIRTGEFPDAVAGMSGQVIIVSQHDFELSPNETKEVTFGSIYNRSKLEGALADFGRLEEGSGAQLSRGPAILTSSPVVSEAAAWALSQLEGVPNSRSTFDKLEALPVLCLVDPAGANAVVAGAKSRVARDGSFPHSSDPQSPGILETALMALGLSRHLLLSGDKKLIRSSYPLLKRVAGYLMSVSKDYAIRPDHSLPQGWRRLLGSGYPVGEIPEVSLAVAGALAAASQVARRMSKSDDASKLRERSEMVAEGVRKRLVDDRGYLALCLDPSGRLRTEDTIDSALAAFRHPFNESSELAVAHRLLEKDFDTPYGPRTVPRSNNVYFNGTYGCGQLGGYWTRAALGHALLCYRLGLAGIGSLSVQKVAKLVTDDATKLGGSPGNFPLWLDIEGNKSYGDESDLVAAGRYVEGLVEGELGLSIASDSISLSPPPSSGFKWVLLSNIWLGEQASVFVGRAAGKSATFVASGRLDSPEGLVFSKAEVLEPPSRGVSAIAFYGPGQVICIGSTAVAPAQGSVSFSPRASDLANKLSTPLESYDPAKGTWVKVGSLRVSPKMSFEVSIGPGEWKAFRVSNL
jgi:hypothetical protein